MNYSDKLLIIYTVFILYYRELCILQFKKKKTFFQRLIFREIFLLLLLLYFTIDTVTLQSVCVRKLSMACLVRFFVFPHFNVYYYFYYSLILNICPSGNPTSQHSWQCVQHVNRCQLNKLLKIRVHLIVCYLLHCNVVGGDQSL